MLTDRLHKPQQPPKVLIGARVKSNADPVADSFHRVRGQASHILGLVQRCSSSLSNGL